jgi:dihydrofolate synthase/folylpolyglutamate synthase
LSAEPVASVEAAIDRLGADNEAHGPYRILICGSLYLAGSVLAANGTPPV